MKLSIITVNLNNAVGLKRTIESVVAQTFTDYEYIIIDGGSTDGSVDIIKQYADRISYWVSKPDKGIYHAMNKGIRKAKGEYLIFMNSGDCFVPDVLIKVYDQLSSDIVCGNAELVSGNGKKWVYDSPSSEDLSLYRFLHSSLPHQASFIKKALFQNNLYNENYKIVSDWEFFIKRLIFDNCSYYHIDLLIAITEPDGISSNRSPVHEEERVQVLKQILPSRILQDYEFLSEIKKNYFSYQLGQIIIWPLKKIRAAIKFFF